MLGVLLASGTLVLCACSNLGGLSSAGGHTINLTSEPPGATVFADGNEIGVTPLAFRPGEIFRTGFASSDTAIIGYRYVGKLAVKRPGCSDYLTPVDDSLLSRDIHVRLDCDPDYQPPAAPAADAARSRSVLPDSAEQRLLRIEGLHDKGLLSDEEYRQLRQRVLDTL
jgi:hypothetical protein